MVGTIFLAAIAVIGFFLFMLLTQSLYLVRQAEVILIERFGQFSRILYPGLHIIIPFVDNPRRVQWTYLYQTDGRRYHSYVRRTYRIDLREAVYDFPKQNVITKDNVTMEINALLYYQIMDPKSAVYQVSNLPDAIEKLTQTTLRNVIGSMDLDASLVSRDDINHRLCMILDEATDKWGVKVNRVELQEVNPPHDIRQAMEKQMRAERDRRAIILESEGKKQAAILRAQGVQQAQVLEAQGKAEARLKLAQAEARSIKVVQDAMPKSADPAAYLIAQQYIRAFSRMTDGKDNKVVVLPYEATSVMGSLSGIKTLFKDIG